MINRSDDGENVAAARQFDLIFERFHGDVFRYCVRRLGRSDGEDAAAEVFAVAWRRLNEVPPGESTRPWLFGVAYRVVGNQYRGRARRGRMIARLEGMPGGGPATPEHASVDAEVSIVTAALESLPPADRELLRMVAWDRLSRAEMSAVLGVSENVLDQRMFRARNRLRKRLEGPSTTAQRMEA